MKFIFACLSGILILSKAAYADGKATEGDEVVLNKLYPKAGKVEAALGAGLIMNQSYLNSFYGSVKAAYFARESWGLGLTLMSVVNQDNEARRCIESFYNDPNERLAPECLSQDPDEAIRQVEDANIGPAYVPIRELQAIYALEYLWNPVYGKQIVLLRGTSYFDLQISIGAGVAQSLYYELRAHIRDRPDVSSRGTLPGEENPDLPPVGVGIDEFDSAGFFYGEEGRPLPRQETLPVTSLGLTQRFHFAKRFSFAIDFHNYTVLGSEQGFETFFTLGGDLGIRF